MSTLHRPVRHALLTATALLLAACSPAGSTDPASEPEDNLDDDLRVCAGGPVQYGLDVSVHNGHINWQKVKASGKVFAFARVSDGLNYPDTEFAKNWAGIEAAGLYRGAYQYFRPGQDAIKQADMMIAAIGERGAKDLPPVIDVETSNGQSGATVVKAVKAWIDRVKEKTGRDPVIYAAGGFWNTLPGTGQFAPYKLWVANYGAQCPYMPATWSEWSFWQYSESGSVPGVSGGIDLDVFNGTLDDLAAFAGGPAGECGGDADCPAGSTCDLSSGPGKCVPGLLPLGAACTSDAECGADGQERVCASTEKVCIAGCHEDADCPAGKTCDQTQSPWACSAPKPVDECPVLAYPSGIHLQTVKDAATTKSYEGHLGPGQEAPVCFVDVDNLHDPVAKTTYDIGVKVAAHFQLVELVGTEIDQGYGHFVLVRPEAVASLEAFRVATGGPVSVTSGFRGPKHQEDVCNDLCGNPLGCPGTCANNSRHMWGDAFDLPVKFYSQYYSDLACDAGFKFVYLESGTHLHVDQNPAYEGCVQQ